MRIDASSFSPFAAARPARNRLMLPVLCAAVFLAQLDTSVANLAIRSIGEHFAASMSARQWIIDSYNLVYAAFLLTGGLLADLFGRRFDCAMITPVESCLSPTGSRWNGAASPR
jgi:MFS transporter, DHA2 family, methylenomycin A resistance protein